MEESKNLPISTRIKNGALLVLYTIGTMFKKPKLLILPLIALAITAPLMYYASPYIANPKENLLILLVISIISSFIIPILVMFPSMYMSMQLFQNKPISFGSSILFALKNFWKFIVLPLLILIPTTIPLMIMGFFSISLLKINYFVATTIFISTLVAFFVALIILIAALLYVLPFWTFEKKGFFAATKNSFNLMKKTTVETLSSIFIFTLIVSPIILIPLAFSIPLAQIKGYMAPISSPIGGLAGAIFQAYMYARYRNINTESLIPTNLINIKAEEK